MPVAAAATNSPPGIPSGSGKPNKEKVGNVTKAQVEVRRPERMQERERDNVNSVSCSSWCCAADLLPAHTQAWHAHCSSNAHALLPHSSTAHCRAACAPVLCRAPQEIAKRKLPDTNTVKLDSACRMVEGTARSLGLIVVD